MHKAFPPLIGRDAQILILGTFPSPVSRERAEYYANKQNKFWQIIFDVYGEKFDNPDYDKKKLVLFENRLALWDVVVECEIIGAADSSIKKPVFNTAIPQFIKDNGISSVIFNGQKAREFYLKGIGDTNGAALPSTSPANAATSYGKKLSVWRKALCEK